MNRREQRLGVWLIMPSVLYVVVFVGYPALYGFISSLQAQYGFGPARFIGLRNYFEMVAQPDFLAAVWRTAWWTIGTVVPQVVLGTLAALLLTREFHGRGVFRALILFPWAIPTVVAGITWRWMFSDLYGIINLFLTKLGVIPQPVAWLAAPASAALAVEVVGVWKYYPFVTINVLARLQMIPQDLYEAARVDGASPWQQFVHVTLPQLKGVLIVVTLLRILYMVPKFDIIWILTSGGPARATETLSILAYTKAFLGFNLGQGAAIAMILFVILAALSAVYVLFQNSAAGEEL